MNLSPAENKKKRVGQNSNKRSSAFFVHRRSRSARSKRDNRSVEDDNEVNTLDIAIGDHSNGDSSSKESKVLQNVNAKEANAVDKN